MIKSTAMERACHRVITGIIMSDRDFAGSIPAVYDAYLVPLIFQHYAEDLARRTAALKPRDVLETAAGTGVVTRALVEKLDSQARLMVTDLNQAMLDHAKGRLPGDTRIKWQQADALALPFAAQSFDVVVCQFGVMFFPDKIAGFAEARRVLRAGGTFLFTAWDRIEANEFACVVTEAAASVFPDDPPRFLARTPYGYHDVGLIRENLARAGFSIASLSSEDRTCTAPSPRHAAIAFCQGTPLRSEIESRDPRCLDAVLDRAESYLAERFGSGIISGKMRAHVVAAQ